MKLKKIALALGLGLFTFNATANIDFTKLTAEEQEQLGKVVSEYLIKNPSFLVKASENLEQILAKEAAENASKAILDNAHLLLDKKSPNNGVKNSKFTLIEFFDYHCPYCIRFDKSVSEFSKNNKDVQVIYKDFAYQTEASRYAAVIGAFIFEKEGVDGYMKFHNEVYKQMEARQLNTKEQVEQIAKSITKKAIEHLEKYEMITQDSYELGRTIGVTGTPSAILIETDNPRGITTYMFRGAVSTDALQSKLNELKEIAKENK